MRAFARGACGAMAGRSYNTTSLSHGTLPVPLLFTRCSKVFKAKDRATGRLVALKRMLPHHESEGFPRTETREIKILKSLSHPNMVQLLGVVTSLGTREHSAGRAAAAAASTSAATTALAEPPEPSQSDRSGDIYMVFEYVDYDLSGLLDSGYRFPEATIKSLIFQLLKVLDFLHSAGYAHRDLKCANILLTDDCVLKLGDFGLARALALPGAAPMTPTVVTLWYRPPELLLGAREYGPAVDMWSVGCILLELLSGKPAFPARTEAEQARAIFNIVGTPPADSMLRTLPLWGSTMELGGPGFEERKNRLSEWLATKYAKELRSADTRELLLRLLEPDPRKRATASEVLSARWFTAEPRLNKEDPVFVYAAAGDGDTAASGSPAVSRGGSAAPVGCVRLPLISSHPSFMAGTDLHEFTARERRRGAAAAASGAGEGGGGGASRPAALRSGADSGGGGGASRAAAARSGADNSGAGGGGKRPRPSLADDAATEAVTTTAAASASGQKNPRNSTAALEPVTGTGVGAPQLPPPPLPPPFPPPLSAAALHTAALDAEIALDLERKVTELCSMPVVDEEAARNKLGKCEDMLQQFREMLETLETPNNPASGSQVAMCMRKTESWLQHEIDVLRGTARQRHAPDWAPDHAAAAAVAAPPHFTHQQKQHTQQPYDLPPPLLLHQQQHRQLLQREQQYQQPPMQHLQQQQPMMQFRGPPLPYEAQQHYLPPPQQHQQQLLHFQHMQHPYQGGGGQGQGQHGPVPPQTSYPPVHAPQQSSHYYAGRPDRSGGGRHHHR